MAKNVAASVHQRLINKARQEKRPFQELLQYYAMERFLYRMASTEYANAFILKGALLLKATGIGQSRPTKDIDLLSESTEDIKVLEDVFRTCCAVPLDDGLLFDAASVRGIEIREEQAYQGVRVTFTGNLGNAIISMQVDIGFGDAVTPGPVWIEYPTLLEHESPKLQGYPLETVVAEKYQAMVALDLANSRMKDFYDIWFIAGTQRITGGELGAAIKSTFQRRKTELPAEIPTALTPIFSRDKDKVIQWKAFNRKLKDTEAPGELSEVVEKLQYFLWPITVAITQDRKITEVWTPEKGWDK
ncbi:MAG: nucleotidyl transferase AbiEii/AbiGii toxin family protein [Balneolaceae bacterium]|nr:nucleotidyl transferase AbiEii/AbiGii toxin family protein [Balneolaceae bacterium]